MTPEIKKLQLLNDLITQTLDVVNQRSMLGGLSHTQWMGHNPLLNTPVTNPLLAQFGAPMISNPLINNPINPLLGGLSHTSYVPTQTAFLPQGAGFVPQTTTVPFANDPRFIGPQTGWMLPQTVGLSHSNIDPRFSYDWRLGNVQMLPWQAPVYGYNYSVDPRFRSMGW